MNPYESPVAAHEKPPFKLSWTMLLFLAVGLLIAAALITPALMPAIRSGTHRSIPIDADVSTNNADVLEPTTNP